MSNDFSLQYGWLLWTVFAVYVLSFCIQLYYYLVIYSKFSWLTDDKLAVSSDLPPVSVIICARNEAKNLQEHLPLLLNLDYPNYEVVVVNDCSYDNSKEILEKFEKQYPNLKVTTLDEEVVNRHDKKFAVTIGIKAAKNDLLVLTDADCRPKSRMWLRELVKYYTPSTQLLLGYGAYQKENSFVNKVIRFDTFFIALQYFAAAIIGRPYMGVGRNLSYKKALFFKNKGFASHSHLLSGDDDLFVNQVARPNNTAISFNEKSHTVSKPKDNFVDWFEQKRRHLTTSPYYKTADKMYIGLQLLSAFVFYLGFLTLMVFLFNPILVVILFLIRMVVQLVVLNKAMDKLDEGDLLVWTPILDFVITFIYPLLAISNTFNEEPRWK